ncbi:MAG: efflux RND transporter periplasmic adaptor subunit, partial [Phycisphaerae bacterium]
ALAKLDSLTRLTSFSVEFVDAAAQGPASSVSRGDIQARSHASACETTDELAFTITNELRNKLGCEQVALGLVRRRHVRILAISGLDQVRQQSPGVVGLTAAMEECLDAGESIVYQRGGGWSGGGTAKAFRLHKHWHAIAKGDGVASVPLKAHNEITAILSLRQSADRPLTAEHVEQIRKRVEPFAGALQLTERANRGLVRHLRDSIHAAGSSLMEVGHWGRKAVVVGVLVLAGWFAFGTVDYDLAVDAVVTAAETKHITAPFDGVIVAAAAVEGDSIQAGQVLCRFDDRQQGQRRAQLLAELEVWERTMDKARADGQPFEVQLARAKHTLAQAKLDIVERRMEQAVIRAPFAGVVVAGDLRKRIGGVALRGEALFEIAPLDRWTLELHVPDAVSANLSPDLTGVFTSYARADRTRGFRIARVLASAQQRKTANVFIAEADIDGRESWIRPGMEGVARVHIGTKPVWWIALHKVIDYLRINFWL